MSDMSDTVALAVHKGVQTVQVDQAEIDKLREDNARLQQWVNMLQRGMTINCVYCGHTYGPNTIEGTPRDALERHIAECPDHPLAACRRELAAVKKDRATYRGAFDKLFAAVQEHHAQRGMARCHENDTKLYQVAGLEPITEALPPIEAHRQECDVYRAGLYNVPVGGEPCTEVVRLQEEVARLKANALPRLAPEPKEFTAPRGPSIPFNTRNELPYRSQCTCGCHTDPGTMHITPCCQSDPFTPCCQPDPVPAAVPSAPDPPLATIRLGTMWMATYRCVKVIAEQGALVGIVSAKNDTLVLAVRGVGMPWPSGQAVSAVMEIGPEQPEYVVGIAPPLPEKSNA